MHEFTPECVNVVAQTSLEHTVHTKKWFKVHTLIVQVCTLIIVTIAVPLGSGLATFLIEVKVEPQIFMFAMIEALLHTEGCKSAPEGVQRLLVQT